MQTITKDDLAAYCAHLRAEDRSAATIYKYLRNATAFALWLNDADLSKESATAWKHELVQRGYHPATVNAALAALNGFFRFLGRDDCRLRFLKLQRRAFRDQSRELTQGDYAALVSAAQRTGKARLALLIETIGSTGVRVSEVAYITVEAAQRGCAEIALKGKIRTILLPAKLCRKLLKYAKSQRIDRGAVFRTRTGRAHHAPPDLGGDEGDLQGHQRGAEQSVPAQPAASVCRDILPRVPRHRQAGGRNGSQLH